MGSAQTQGVRRTIRGWIGVALAAGVMAVGAAAGAYAAPSHSDPHETAAQSEADHMIASFVAPPGSVRAKSRPNPVPPDLKGPPVHEMISTQTKAIGWYYTPMPPGQVLSWLSTHPPVGARLGGWGSGSSGPAFTAFEFPTPHSTLYVTPEAGSDGRTVIRLDATVDWVPSRTPDSLVRSGAKSVAVLTVSRSVPPQRLPTAETTVLQSTDPHLVGRVVDLLNALPPPPGGRQKCPMDEGISVAVTLDGYGEAEADPEGCGRVVLTLAGRQQQILSGGPELIRQVYALFGVTWQGPLPPTGPGSD